MSFFLEGTCIFAYNFLVIYKLRGHRMNHVIEKKISTFLLISFILGWIVQSLGLQQEHAGNTEVGEAIIIASTFVPLLAVVLAQHFHMDTESCGIRWALPGKKDLKYVFMSWILPIVLTFLGAVLYFLIFKGEFSLSFLNTDAGRLTLEHGVHLLIFEAIVSAIEGIGGEIGWHSYFIPLLEKKYGVAKAIIICGIVWGLWYAPLIINGHDFGVGYFGAPFTGILTLCVYFTLLSAFFTWLHMKTETIYVPALAHGTFAAVEQYSLNFEKVYPTGHILGPSLPGVISMIPLLIFVCILVKMKAFKEEEEAHE